MRKACRHRVVMTAFAAALGGCIPHQNVAMQGDASSVAISYVGDVADTLPIARRHCAQFEREPVLSTTKENVAYYACKKAGISP